MKRARPVDVTAANDVDLARAATRGSARAFAELYRRHAPAAWRLACVVTLAADRAAPSVCSAFAVVLDGGFEGGFDNGFDAGSGGASGTRKGGEGVDVRTAVLAETRRIALTGGNAVLPPTVARTDRDRVARAVAAVPERWRTALWLTHDHPTDAGADAAVLRTSAAGAARLAARATDAVQEAVSRRDDARLVTAGDIGAALSALAPPLPDKLACAAERQWAEARTARRQRMASAQRRIAMAGRPPLPLLHHQLVLASGTLLGLP